MPTPTGAARTALMKARPTGVKEAIGNGEGLPRWALVRFACRWAGRVASMYCRPDKAVVRAAIATADEAASTGTPPPPEDGRFASLWKRYGDEATAAAKGPLDESYYAAASAYSAYAAAAAAAVGGPALVIAAGDAGVQALSAHRASPRATAASAAKLLSAMLNDIARLRALARERQWSDHTPVPASLRPSRNPSSRRIGGATEHESAGLVHRVSVTSGRSQSGVTVVINGSSRAIRDQIAARIAAKAQEILCDAAGALVAPASVESPTPTAALLGAAGLLGESAYWLLAEIGQHRNYTISLSKWCDGVMNRREGRAYALELKSLGYVAQDAREKWAATDAGMQYLADHPPTSRPRITGAPAAHQVAPS